METGVSEIVWRPSEEDVERANVTRLMRAHGIGSYDELVKRSQDDTEWFWEAVVKDLGIEFFEPYTTVLDQSKGVPWATGHVRLLHGASADSRRCRIDRRGSRESCHLKPPRDQDAYA